jgi:hypothetical protein
MHKTGYRLNILRETIMGRELFDYAFKVYSNCWKFKHPTPEDFQNYGRRLAVDLDWFLEAGTQLILSTSVL